MRAVLMNERRRAEGLTKCLTDGCDHVGGAFREKVNAPKIDESTRSRVTKRRSSISQMKTPT